MYKVANKIMESLTKTVDVSFDIKNFVCPISQEIFFDPVIAEDGHIYERQMIEQWFNTNSTSPITREDIDTNVKDCQIIKNIVNIILEKYPNLKDMQFKIDNTHMSNVNFISKYIENENYNKLLNYINYDVAFLVDSQLFTLLLGADVEIIKYVLTNSNVFELIKNGYGNLLYELAKGHFTIFKYVMNTLTELYDDSIQFDEAFLKICENESPEIIKYMINIKNINLNCANVNVWSPIHFACYRSLSNIIIELVNKKVDLECTTDAGWRPIHAACLYCDENTIRFLIKKNVNLKTKIRKYKNEVVNYGCCDLIKLNDKLSESSKDKLMDLIYNLTIDYVDDFAIIHLTKEDRSATRNIKIKNKNKNKK